MNYPIAIYPGNRRTAWSVVVPDLPAANDADFDTEWLDSVLSVAVVDGVDQALAHIARHGSEHTDAIVTEDAAVAETFANAFMSMVFTFGVFQRQAEAEELPGFMNSRLPGQPGAPLVLHDVPAAAVRVSPV